MSCNEAFRKLGDSHNFGRVVCLSDRGSLLKPRPTLWEFAFLDDRSSLKQLLRQLNIFPPEWPSLAIEKFQNFHSLAEVEHLSLNPLGELSDLDLECLGRQAGTLLALSLWFGLTDLHVDNILLGRRRGVPVLMPIDIECIWNNPVLLSNTLLLVPNKITQEHCGLKKLLELNSPLLAASTLWQFFQAFKRLEAEADSVRQAFTSLIGEGEAYSRVLLRPTREYHASFAESNSVKHFPYCKAEKEQMARGDVPYFYRDIRSRSVYFFSERMVPVELEEEYLSHSLRQNPFLIFTADRKHLVPRKHAEYGLLQIANNFLFKAPNSLSFSYHDLFLKKEGTRLSISLAEITASGFY